MTEAEPIPMQSLSKTLFVMFKIHIAITIVAIFAGIFEYYDYSNAIGKVDIEQELLASDYVTMVVGLLQTIIFITISIVFLKWVYRLNKNLNILSDWKLKFTPGWSVGWYFIPIVCLYKPYQAMREIFLTCQMDRNGNTQLLGTWWALWLASTFAAQFVMRLSFSPFNSDSFLTTTVAYLLTDAIDLVLAFVAFKLIRETWSAYQENFSEAIEPELRINPSTQDPNPV